MRDLSKDAWFAGFADGEGCFELAGAPRGRVQPQFSINLRLDDIAILAELQGTFGGRLHHRPARNSHPQADWVVKRKEALAGLVRYFDEFEPRAKKAADYGIWRQAVWVYCESSSLDPRLPGLREALRRVREYGADLPDLVDPFDVQIGLGIE